MQRRPATVAVVVTWVMVAVGTAGPAAAQDASIISCPDFGLIEQQIEVSPDGESSFALDAAGRSTIRFTRGAVSEVSRYQISRLPDAAGFSITPIGSTSTFDRDVHIHLYWGKCAAEEGAKAQFIAWDKPGNGVWQKVPGNQGSGALVRHVRTRSFTAFALAM